MGPRRADASRFNLRRMRRTLSRRHLLRWTASGIASLVTLPGVACGKKQAKGAANAPGTKPLSGGNLRVWCTTDPFNFDMTYTGQSFANQHCTDLAYESLLGFRYGADVQPDQFTVVPNLADRWEAPDGITYTFHLRNGLKFANLPPANGRDLTASGSPIFRTISWPLVKQPPVPL